MKGSLSVSLLILILTLTLEINAVEYEVVSHCPFVPPNTLLASLEDCTKYYICERNGEVTEKHCAEKTTFSLKALRCLSTTDKNCTNNVIIADTCEAIGQGFLPVETDCKEYRYCEDGKEIGKGICPRNTYFRDGICVYGDCADEVPLPEIITDECDFIPENIFFGSQWDCSNWNICYQGALYSDRCPFYLVFDIIKQECVYNRNSDICGIRPEW